MPRISYVPKKFHAATLQIIIRANVICQEYADAGYDLTLRQLFYQFVARDMLPNKQSEYKRLGDIVSDARLAGLLDWKYIVDRTRNVQSNSHWDSPGHIVSEDSRVFQYDKWANQEHRVEVYVEKEALIGVVERPCRENDVAYFACRGYVSQSELWSAAQRHIGYELGFEMAGNQRASMAPVNRRQKIIVLHLGDHDPSGIDMTRDIRRRLEQFGASTEVIRIALNMEQVQDYNPPPNPARETDARFASYAEQYGDESWELDALDPSVINDLIEEHIKQYRDEEKWEAALAREQEARQRLQRVADRWEDVADFLAGEDESLS